MPLQSHISLYWTSYFDDRGLDASIASKYLSVVNECVKNGVPPILSIDHLAALIGVSEESIFTVLYGKERMYSEFEVPKRTGGSRIIHSPRSKVRICQYWILKNILHNLPVSKIATAYYKGASILDNASRHISRERIAKLDIEAFFPSISERMVTRAFQELGYPNQVAWALARMCCHRKKLPQGGVTSGALSNLVCKKLDFSLYRFARKQKLRITRYADDFTISGRSLERWHVAYVAKSFARYGFIENRKKRVIYEGYKPARVTGLTVTDKVRVPRKLRQEVRKNIYFIYKFGIDGHLSRMDNFDYVDIYRLAGKLEFWRSIEGQSKEVAELQIKLQDAITRSGKLIFPSPNAQLFE